MIFFNNSELKRQKIKILDIEMELEKMKTHINSIRGLVNRKLGYEKEEEGAQEEENEEKLNKKKKKYSNQEDEEDEEDEEEDYEDDTKINKRKEMRRNNKEMAYGGMFPSDPLGRGI